jgi:hypothetical protein
MVSMPVEEPETMPPATLAVVLVLPHIPPAVASDKVTGVPIHTVVGPVMAAALGINFAKKHHTLLPHKLSDKLRL